MATASTSTSKPASEPVEAPAAAETPATMSSKSKGKQPATAEDEEADEDDDDEEEAEEGEPQWHEDGEAAEADKPAQGDWQAVWAPQANAYYFWNQKTNETTWTNPLEPAPTASATTATPSTTVEERPKDYGGIDPELAYLDPMLAYGARTGVTGAQTAKFNARTGRFEGADARTPDYVSEQSRYKRQSAFFFDVDGWEKQNDAEQERKRQLAADGKLPDAKRQKPPTKEELQRYKERAAEKKKKKLAAWLAD